MKILPIVTALIVSVALYFFIFQRDALTGGAPTAEASTQTTVDETTAPAGIETSEPVAIKVVAMLSTAQEVESGVILRGRTEAARQVSVAAETSGLVVSEPLRKGTFVDAGDIMCQLDPGTREASLAEARARLAEAEGGIPEAEAALTEAKARVEEALINVNVARQGVRDGFSTETRLATAEAAAEAANAGVQRAMSQIAGAQAGIESAAAGVASAETEISRLTIKAPFAGLLETDTAELGSLMQPGSPCATIIQLDPIKLVGFVPEAQVSKVELGALAGARLTDESEVGGRVTFLSRSSDPTTRTFRVEVEVPNSDLAVRDGQTAEILIQAEGRQAHLIPQSALTLDDEGELGVRTVAEDETALFFPVTLLRDTVDGVWVTDLPDEVRIITLGQEYVTDGVAVAPTYMEAEG